MRPERAQQVIAILKEHDPQDPRMCAGQAFYSGRNAGYDLAETLSEIGWAISYIDGDYFWMADHPLTGDRLRYIEGDVDVVA